MPLRQLCYSTEEPARRSENLYKRQIRAQVEAGHNEKIVTTDVDKCLLVAPPIEFS